jgi:hypothetical protein
MTFSSLFNQLLTGKDNKTHDIARWSWLTTTLVIIGGSFWNAYHTTAFSITEFAQAIGVIAGAHGAAVLMKKDSEPSSVEDAPNEKN